MSDSWDAKEYGAKVPFVSGLGAHLIDLLDLRSGEDVLDLGCGEGALSQELVAQGAQVVAVDSSKSMVESARTQGIDARVVDGQALDFDQQFDAVFSNAALHWMTEPGRVLTGVASALRPGGRFVAEFGGHGNVAAVAAAMLAVRAKWVDQDEFEFPWYFPTKEEYQELLIQNGFRVEFIENFWRPTRLTGGIKGWLEVFSAPFRRGISTAGENAFIEEVTELLRPLLCDSKGNWTALYVRLRFKAILMENPRR